SVLIALTLAAAAAPPTARAAPPMPYVDKGQCPFECCTFGTWTANRRTAVLRAARADAPVAFELAKGETVRVPTGDVVTVRAGRVRALRATTIGEDGDATRLAAGDVFYDLHHVEVLDELVWFRGHVFVAETRADRPGPAIDHPELEVLELPIVQWWVEVHDAHGHVGWTMRTDDFDGEDSCA